MAKKTTTKISVIIGVFYPTTTEIIDLVAEKNKKFDQVIIMHLNGTDDPAYKGSEELGDLIYLKVCTEFLPYTKVSTCCINTSYTPNHNGGYIINDSMSDGSTYVSEIKRLQDIKPGTQPVYEITVLDNTEINISPTWTPAEFTIAYRKLSQSRGDILSEPAKYANVITENSRRITRYHNIVTGLDKPGLVSFLDNVENAGYSVYKPDDLWFLNEPPTSEQEFKDRLDYIKFNMIQMEHSELSVRPNLIIPFDPVFQTALFAAFADVNEDFFLKNGETVINENIELINEIAHMIQPNHIVIHQTPPENESKTIEVADKILNYPHIADIALKYNKLCVQVYGFEAHYLETDTDIAALSEIIGNPI